MVKEEEAGHVVNLNLSGWAVLMPLTSPLGFLLCNHWSFLSLSFLLSAADLTSQSNLFGFHRGLTWITPAISLFFILLFYHHLLSAESTWVYRSSGSFYVVSLGRVSCPLCTIPFCSGHHPFSLVLLLDSLITPHSVSFFVQKQICSGDAYFRTWLRVQQNPSAAISLLLPFNNCFLSIEGMGHMGKTIFSIDRRSPQYRNPLPTRKPKRRFVFVISISVPWCFVSIHAHGGKEKGRENFRLLQLRKSYSLLPWHSEVQFQVQSPAACLAGPHNIAQLYGGTAQSSCNGSEALGQLDVCLLVLLLECGRERRLRAGTSTYWIRMLLWSEDEAEPLIFWVKSRFSAYLPMPHFAHLCSSLTQLLVLPYTPDLLRLFYFLHSLTPPGSCLLIYLFLFDLK